MESCCALLIKFTFLKSYDGLVSKDIDCLSGGLYISSSLNKSSSGFNVEAKVGAWQKNHF